MSYLRVLFICIIPLLLGAATPAKTFQITGVKNEILQNVQQRLTEFKQNNRNKELTAIMLQEQTEQALYPYGYFKSEILIAGPSNKGIWSIIIHLGPVMRVNRLTLTIVGAGQHDPIIEKARIQSPLHTNMALITERYESTKMNLLNACEAQGYIHALFEKSEVLIDKAKNLADIDLILNTGPRFYFGEIKFPEKHYLSNELLYRYVPFEKGTPFSNEKLLAFNNNLAASGYFKATDVKPAENNTNHVPLIVNLEPVERTNYTLGAGYGTDTGPRGRVGLHVIPVNAHGDQFNAIAQGSVSQNALQMQYLIPGHDPVHDHFSINGGFTNLNYTSGSSNSLLGSIAKLHAKNDFQSNLSLNAMHERFTYTGKPRTEKNVFYPKGFVAWRHVTDELFSPSGYNLSLSGFAASKAILSDISVASATIEAKGALTLESIRTRLYLHAIQSVAAIDDVYDLPLSLALLLGGAENMKGYSFNSIGPGKLLTYAGAELQKETFENWYVVGFIDMGNVYRPSTQPFQYDVGGGLMWRSPVGPIKVVVAQPTLTPQKPFHGPGLRLVINMGPDL